MIQDKTILHLFNLSLDLDNPVLATTNLWVNEFASHFEVVNVYSTHVGRHEVLPNVNVFQLGGGTLKARVYALARLTMIVPRVFHHRKQCVVFHHQSPRTAVFPGIFFRLFGITQGVWYSHSKKPFSLVCGSLIVNKIYSSSVHSLPMNTVKGNYFGHGVDTISATRASLGNQIRENQILFVGRLDPIKRLEECISAIAKVPENDIEFVAVGPSSKHSSYLESLDILSKKVQAKFRREEPIIHDQVFGRMAKSQMYFAGMRNSVDKSCLEAAASGCFVVTTDIDSAKLSGMTLFWDKFFGLDQLPSLEDQINLIKGMEKRFIEQARLEIQSNSARMNSASRLITRISESLREG